MRDTITISIPNPCHADWDAMRPETNGRYCKKCSFQVIDFTGMTDAEMLVTIRRLGEKRCGRFNSNQINRALREPLSVNSKTKWKAVLTGLVALLSFRNLIAGDNAEHSALVLERSGSSAAKMSDTNLKVQAVLKSDTAEKAVVIRGRVMDTYNKKSGMRNKGERPLKGVIVSTSDDQYSTTTDRQGYFSMKVLVKPGLEIIFEGKNAGKTIPLSEFLLHKRPLRVRLNYFLFQGRF